MSRLVAPPGWSAAAGRAASASTSAAGKAVSFFIGSVLLGCHGQGTPTGGARNGPERKKGGAEAPPGATGRLIPLDADAAGGDDGRARGARRQRAADVDALVSPSRAPGTAPGSGALGPPCGLHSMDAPAASIADRPRRAVAIHVHGEGRQGAGRDTALELDPVTLAASVDHAGRAGRRGRRRARGGRRADGRTLQLDLPGQDVLRGGRHRRLPHALHVDLAAELDLRGDAGAIALPDGRRAGARDPPSCRRSRTGCRRPGSPR